MKQIQWLFSFIAIVISLLCGVTISNAEVTNRRNSYMGDLLEHTDNIYTVREAIETLQPYFKSDCTKRARLKKNLANAIYKSAITYDIDFRYAVALASRESSFLPIIGARPVEGSKARGYFQVLVSGAAVSKCSDGCNQFNVTCNAETAMCWLDWCRRKCGNNPWMYLGGYGRSYCPANPRAAKNWPELRALRSKLCNGFGEKACNELLPL